MNTFIYMYIYSIYIYIYIYVIGYSKNTVFLFFCCCRFQGKFEMNKFLLDERHLKQFLED